MTNIDMTFYLNHMTHICITYHILTKYGSLLLCKILGNVCYYFSMLHIMSIVHWYLYFFSLFLVGWKTWLGVESGWARTEVPSLYFWKCEHSELLSTNQNRAIKSCLLVWFGLSYKNTLTQVLVGKESTWEEDHSNLGAGFGQLEDFCTSWVKNFDVNPRLVALSLCGTSKMWMRMAVFVKIASAIFVFAMELTSVPKKSPQTSCLSGLFVCFSFSHNI